MLPVSCAGWVLQGLGAVQESTRRWRLIIRYQVHCVCAGWYCVGCEQYKDEEEMAPGHVCPLHRAPCQERREENYFFALARYQRQIEVGLPGDLPFALRRRQASILACQQQIQG